jgi:hypothetical protein
MEVGLALFGGVRVTLFPEVILTFFGEVCLALGEVRGLFFGEVRLGLFATALVALCRMSLRSLQALCRHDQPVFVFVSRGAPQGKA